MGRSHVRTRRDADPAGYGFILEELERPGDPRRLFEASRRDAPLEVEIGSGKGSFLVAESEIRADVLFVGVERARATGCTPRIGSAGGNGRTPGSSGGMLARPWKRCLQVRLPACTRISPIPGRNGGTRIAAC